MFSKGLSGSFLGTDGRLNGDGRVWVVGEGGTGRGLDTFILGGESKNRGVVTTLFGECETAFDAEGVVTFGVVDAPTNPNLLGTPARGLRGSVARGVCGDVIAFEGGSGTLNPPLGFSESRVGRIEILGGRIPDSRFAFTLATTAARASEEIVGAAKLVLDLVLLVRLVETVEAGVVPGVDDGIVDRREDIESVAWLPAEEETLFLDELFHEGMLGRWPLGPDA